MTALEQYVQLTVRERAIQEVKKDLLKKVIAEIPKWPRGKAIAFGVCLHLSTKSKEKLTGRFGMKLKLLTESIKRLKARARKAGCARKTHTTTVVVQIPRSIANELYKSVPEYNEHFGK